MSDSGKITIAIDRGGTFTDIWASIGRPDEQSKWIGLSFILLMQAKRQQMIPQKPPVVQTSS
jgi:hypothetical protein